MSEFSEILSQHIHNKDIKTYALAQYCGLDRSNMYKVINGKRKPTSEAMVDKMCFISFRNLTLQLQIFLLLITDLNPFPRQRMSYSWTRPARWTALCWISFRWTFTKKTDISVCSFSRITTFLWTCWLRKIRVLPEYVSTIWSVWTIMPKLHIHIKTIIFTAWNRFFLYMEAVMNTIAFTTTIISHLKIIHWSCFLILLLHRNTRVFSHRIWQEDIWRAQLLLLRCL